MIIGGPFAFLAGLFALGAAGVGQTHRDAKIKAGTTSLNFYAYNKAHNIADFTSDELKDYAGEGYITPSAFGSGGGLGTKKYFGGLDGERVMRDLAQRENMEENSSDVFQAMSHLYLDRIFMLVGIETNSLYFAADYMEYFTDPKWRCEYYEMYKDEKNEPLIPEVKLQQTLEESNQIREMRKQRKIWGQINSPQFTLDYIVHSYAGEYSPLKVPRKKIKFLEDVTVESKEE